MSEYKTIEDIENQIRKTPLIERLEKSRKIIGKLASEGRYPKMSIPVQPTDEDIFVSTTLLDAMEFISRIASEGGNLIVEDEPCNECGMRHTPGIMGW